MSNRTTLTSSATAVCLALIAMACGKGKNAGAATDNSQVRAIATVAMARAGFADLSNGVVLTAEFIPYQEVEVMAKVAGFVKKINVDIGDRVHAGQLLAVLEVPEMQKDLVRGVASIERSTAEVARAGNELQRAKSNHDIAHLSYTRLAAVDKARPGLVAQQEIDDAHSKDLAAEAQVDAATSALTATEQQVQVSKAEQGRTQDLFDYTNVTAPFSGVVTKRFANVGTMIQAGTASSTQAMPIVRLSQNSLLRLILPVPESVVPRIRIGQTVEVNVPSMHRTFPGKVERVEGKLDLATRTMNTEVDVQNSNLLLIPGMYAEVNLALDRRAKALSIPVTAVDIAADATDAGAPSGGDRTGSVMAVVEGNRIAQRTVRLGIETSTLVEVLSGLKDGDLVVIGNRASLQAGQQVNPKVTSLAAAGPRGAEAH
jgi:RND family efflux transporter MFP subunit